MDDIKEIQAMTYDLAKELEAATQKMTKKIQAFQSRYEMADADTQAKLKPLVEALDSKVAEIKKAHNQNSKSYDQGLELAKQFYLMASMRTEKEAQQRTALIMSHVQETNVRDLVVSWLDKAWQEHEAKKD